MRRAAVSVPGKISGGHGRLRDRYLRNFPGTARGSLFKLETQLFPSVDPGFAKREDADRVLAQAAEIARILNGLLRTLEVDEA